MSQDDINDRGRYIIEKWQEKARQSLEKWENPLKNAKKGEQYQCHFKLPHDVLLPKFVEIPEIGLKLAQHPIFKYDFLLYGTPTKSGKFTFIFEYYSAYIPDHVFNSSYFRKKSADLLQRYEIELVINPDPRELWKNIPTDRSLEYFKEDSACEQRVTESTCLLAASQRGRSHAHKGLPRDDDFALGHTNGWFLLAVADGAGSAKYSRRGSALACDMAVKSCVERLSGKNELDSYLENLNPSLPSEEWLPKARLLAYNILPQAALEAHKAIRAEARQMGRDIREYATTFLLALAKKFSFGWVVLSFQIGDGAMAVFSEAGSVHLLAEPDEGEYGGQTRFLTMTELFDGNELMRRLNLVIVRDLKGLVLMTDGVSDARFSTLANLRNPRLWWQLWCELADYPAKRDGGLKLLDWLQFWSQGNHDDRTIAMLSLKPPLQLSMGKAFPLPALKNQN